MASAYLFCPVCGAANTQQAAQCFACGQTLQLVTTLASEHLIAQRYRIVSRLGQGGMGTVYKVEDMRLGNRALAVKEMRLQGLDQQQATEAANGFKREALMLAELMQPNLPRIYDHFSELGCWYLVMDYIEGETLDSYLIARGNKLPLTETLTIGMQLCDVLDYLHTRQPPIIFRDLKPSNVMRTPQGHLYLIDFGIARHFKPGQAKDTIAFGSPGYAAPEQYGKQQTAAQADIYSLGAMLHQLLTGDDPSTTPFVFAPLAPGLAPDRLQVLLTRMLNMDARQRPDDIASVKQELQAIAALPSPTRQAGQPIMQTPPVLPTPQVVITAPAKPPVKRARMATLFANALVTEPDRLLCVYRNMHMDWITSLAWSSDGTYVVSGSKDRTAQVWHGTTGQTQTIYKGHTAAWRSASVRDVAWCPTTSNGIWVASASDDETVQVWRAMSGETLMTYHEHHEPVSNISWSPDGTQLVSCSRSSVHLWKFMTGETISSITERKSDFHLVSWLPGGKQLVIGQGAALHIYSVIAGKLNHQWSYMGHNAPVQTLAWSPDGQYAASASDDRTVHIWHPQTGKLLYMHVGHTAAVMALCWSPDSKYLASAGVDGTVQIIDIAKRRVQFVYRGHHTVIYALAWSPDGSCIASGDAHNSVQVWQTM